MEEKRMIKIFIYGKGNRDFNDGKYQINLLL